MYSLLPPTEVKKVFLNETIQNKGATTIDCKSETNSRFVQIEAYILQAFQDFSILLRVSLRFKDLSELRSKW